ncbi:MAG: hypothetical protein IKE64_01330 [Thermoguttaceae bacterium]|nr:hypothetical protein [Thermoguttaceae bacterium]
MMRKNGPPAAVIGGDNILLNYPTGVLTKKTAVCYTSFMALGDFFRPLFGFFAPRSGFHLGRISQTDDSGFAPLSVFV